MPSVIEILMVGEHRDTSALMRQRLAVDGHDIEVMVVPTAEEGLATLQNRPADLLITDVHLPGMGGLEMLQRAQAIRPGIATIILASRASYAEVEAAAALGVARFFRKSVDRSRLLDAVHSVIRDLPVVQSRTPAVKRESQALKVEKPAASEEPAPLPELPQEVKKCLETLLADTGASQLYLILASGQLLTAIGEGPAIDLPRLALSMAAAMRGSFRTAGLLDEPEAAVIHYLTGRQYDLYWANINHGYFLALLSDARVRRGKIGAIWMYARRAIKDLEALLPRLISSVVPPPLAAAEPVITKEQATLPAVGAPEPAARPVRVKSKTPEKDSQVLDQIESLLTGSLTGDIEETDLDAFWDDAVAGAGGAGFNGISFEEARQKGLIAPDFEFEPED